MKCLEFKRLVLSDPTSVAQDFLQHAASCADCQRYRASIEVMDNDLAASLEVAMPLDLIARLQLNQALQQPNANFINTLKANVLGRYSIAASVLLGLVVAGFIYTSQLRLSTEISADYQKILAGVEEHIVENPITPVWSEGDANQSVRTVLASYEPKLKIKHMENLQFARICPMGEYRGLHASMETERGQITFAYIKGEPVSEIFNSSYAGYLTRVKPVRGGNLVIFSANKASLQQADQQLESAMYWDI